MVWSHRYLLVEILLNKLTALCTSAEQCVMVEEVKGRAEKVANRSSSTEEGGRYYVRQSVEETAQGKGVRGMCGTER